MPGDGKHGLEYMPGRSSTKRIIQNQDTAQFLIPDPTQFFTGIAHQRQDHRKIDNEFFRAGVIDLGLLPGSIPGILRVLVDLKSMYLNGFLAQILPHKIPAADNALRQIDDFLFGRIQHGGYQFSGSLIDFVSDGSGCCFGIDCLRQVKTDHRFLGLPVVDRDPGACGHLLQTFVDPLPLECALVNQIVMVVLKFPQIRHDLRDCTLCVGNTAVNQVCQCKISVSAQLFFQKLGHTDNGIQHTTGGILELLPERAEFIGHQLFGCGQLLFALVQFAGGGGALGGKIILKHNGGNRFGTNTALQTV